MNPNNRVAKIKQKMEEIAEADAHDQAEYAALAARNDASVGQKRAELAGRLTPRVTLTNLDRLHDLLRSAASRNYQGPTQLKAYPQLALLMKDDLKDLYGEFRLSPLGEEAMQMAWEHLTALASDSSEAKLKSSAV